MTANVFNKSGVPAPPATETVMVDETPPTITIDAVNSNNVINKAQAAAGVTISGTVSDPELNGSSDVAGQIVTVTLNGKTYSGTVQADGTWSVNVGTTDAQALADGNLPVTANISDKSGNPAPQATRTVTVDQTTPTVTVTSDNTNVNMAHGTATITFSFSEAPTDFGLGHITANGGTLSNLQQSTPPPLRRPSPAMPAPTSATPRSWSTTPGTRPTAIPAPAAAPASRWTR